MAEIDIAHLLLSTVKDEEKHLMEKLSETKERKKNAENIFYECALKIANEITWEKSSDTDPYATLTGHHNNHMMEIRSDLGYLRARITNVDTGEILLPVIENFFLPDDAKIACVSAVLFGDWWKCYKS